jgi:hypothetical protein
MIIKILNFSPDQEIPPENKNGGTVFIPMPNVPNNHQQVLFTDSK